MTLDIKPEELMYLDYPGHTITLLCTSEVERTARVNACRKEPETVGFIESCKGGTFFDIGSNTGSYSFVAAANGLRTYAFEPPGPTFDRLEENVELNMHRYKVFAHPVLLGDEDKTVRFSFSSNEPGAALHRLGWGPLSEAMQMRTLDSYVIDKSLPFPTWMKIDTDGNELRVLLGATECLKHVKALQVELDGTPMSEQVHHFLTRHGFERTLETEHEWSGVSNCRYDRVVDATP